MSEKKRLDEDHFATQLSFSAVRFLEQAVRKEHNICRSLFLSLSFCLSLVVHALLIGNTRTAICRIFRVHRISALRNP